ncbi:uncharacterized protein LOC126403842 [Epinephelus moara]|uniref:uncharacterized protein LOC126403842 n=1 Tax=Epinephelus moara TaxID=300413 RepID=UPI00214F0610|nr:uncharacterized protein LOC126403842 [Epinephelus moara]
MIKQFILPVAAFLAALSSWNYYSQKDEKMDHNETKSLFQQSQKEKEWENVVATLMEQENELEKLTEKPELQHKKNSTKLNFKDELFFDSALTIMTGSMPLKTVFVVLLIHTCARLVGSVSSVFPNMSLAAILFDLAFSLILAVYAMTKWKRQKAELEKKNAQLEKESVEKDEDQEDVVNTMMEMKTELENQRHRLKVRLEEVEGEREVNKQKLQEVENEITERELKFDKPQELLTEKENLLRAQWKLDETKKENERQLLNTERLLEPLEIQLTRIHQKKEADFR